MTPPGFGDPFVVPRPGSCIRRNRLGIAAVDSVMDTGCDITDWKPA